MKKKGVGGAALFVPLLYILVAALLTLWTQATSSMVAVVDIEDVLAEGVLAALSFAGVLLIGRISDDRGIYLPLAAGNLLVFTGFYADVLDEFFQRVPPLLGYKIEDLVWLGMVIGIFGLQRWTKRHEAMRDELKRSEGMFRNLAEESPNMIFINRGGRVVYANRKCEEVMGYTREEFYSKDFDLMRIIAPESRELVKENLRRHMEGEEIPPYEYKLVTRDGREITAIHATRLIDFEGERAILGIVTDVTEARRAEKELREKVEELEKWQRLTIGREAKMVELKKEIKELKKRLERYESRRP
ncbi:MAG: PAS domain S-box protein [Methanobacteriota archaeon]|nr:MAG: PAS domain S-box protein [Euryarchaeota archaeon]